MTSRLGLYLAGLVVAASAVQHSTVAAQSAAQTITVSSPTLKSGQAVPRQHTPDGRNDSPALSWSGVPATAKSLVVFCEDPDAGNPPPFVHWVVYNIPATAKGLPEALPIDPSVPLRSELAGAVEGAGGLCGAI